MTLKAIKRHDNKIASRKVGMVSSEMVVSDQLSLCSADGVPRVHTLGPPWVVLVLTVAVVVT